MKKLITFAMALSTLIGCKKDKEDSVTENETEDYYNCTDFFISGDYSDFCTVDTALVNISDATIDGAGTICAYIIPPLDTNTEVNTSVQFFSWESSEIAQGNFDFTKMESDSTATADSKKFFTEISIDGYEGYVYEGRYANYAKTIMVNYKNVNISTSVVYFKEWYPDVTPCNYDTDELTELMSLVLENM